MTRSEIFIITILAVWLGLNVCYSLLPNAQRALIHRVDLFSLITSFGMFPATPSRYKLYYSDQSIDKTLSPWTELKLIAPYKWYQAFWFPQGQVLANIYSTVNDLVQLMKTKENTPMMDKIHDRFIYKTMMNYVLRHPMAENVRARRFKIEEETGIVKTELREVFVSDLQTI